MTKRRQQPTAVGRPADERRAAGPWWLPHAVAALAAAMVLGNTLMAISMLDEGVACMGGWRVALGETPYRDFFAFITPLSYYVLAVFYKLFGVSILSGRVMAVLMGLGLVLLTARMSRRFVKGPLFAALPMAVLIQAGVGIWPYPSHHWLAIDLTLAAILVVDHWRDRRLVAACFSGGALTALTVWTLPDQGAFFVVASALALLPFVSGPERRRKAIVGWICGGAAASLPFLLVLLKTPPAALWQDLVTFGFTTYRENPGNRLGLFHPFKGIVEPWILGQWRGRPVFAVASTVTSTAIVLAIPASVSLLVVAWWKKWADKWTLGLLTAGAAAFVGPALRRWGPINVQFAVVVPAVVVAWSLSRWRARARGAARYAPQAIAWVLLGCFVAFGGASLARFLQPGALHSVHGRGGTLYSFSGPQAAYLQELIDALEARTQPGQAILCREMPLLNFLAQRPSPVPYNLFHPPYETTAAQEKDAMAILDRKATEWIATYAGEPPPCAFNGYLDSTYSPAWRNDEFILWRRNPTGNP